MRILLDSDGVLSDLTTPWVQLLGLPSDYQPQCYELSCTGKPPDQVKEALYKVCSDADLIEPYPEVREVLAQLREAGHDVVCVTAMFSRKRYKWLKRELKFSSQEIVLAKAKWRIRGDLFIDDDPQQVLKWHQTNPDKAAFVMRRSYNEGVLTHLPRIDSLKDIIGTVVDCAL